MWLLLAYGVVLLGIGGLSSLRRATTRIDGGRIFALHVLFLGAEVVRLLRGDGTASVSLGLALFALAALGSFACRDWWLLSRFDRRATRELIEGSLGRLRIDFEVSPSGYALRTKRARGVIDVRPLPTNRALMRVRSDAPAPKIELLTSLLMKSFEPLVPRLRIRLR